MTEDSPEPTDSVKAIDSPLPADDLQPNPNTFGIPYSEPAFDPNLAYQPPPFTYEEDLNEPQPPSPPPQPGQSRQWRGETEIN